jgi:hypothetical protein
MNRLETQEALYELLSFKLEALENWDNHVYENLAETEYTAFLSRLDAEIENLSSKV